MSEQASTVDIAPIAAAATAIDPAIKAELDQQMAISLNGGMAPAAASPASASATTEPAAADTTTVDPFGIFKEKFGYETPEAAITEFESLRAFKATPPAPEWKFENEQSKQLAEAIQAGKLNEVYEVLDRQMKIDRLTTGEMTPETAADLVKFGMQIKYKDLMPAQIDYKFNKQYGTPAKPGMLPAEDQEEYNERLAAWQTIADDKKMELMIEATIAKPELLATKAKLVFPTINRPEDADFQNYQKLVQENERLAAETTQAYKAFSPTSIATKINFKDEPNKIDFDFSHEPDPESFNKAIEMTSDINLFWKHFTNPDGTPDRQRFLKSIYFALNGEKIITAALNQSKNATIKASLPDNSNGGLVRQLPQTQEPNDLDKMMRASLKGYGGF